MLRVGCRWLLPRQSQFLSSRFFCTPNAEEPPKRTSYLSHNEIKLIGRMKNEVVQFPNGFQSFLLRTATKTIGNIIGVPHTIKANENSLDFPLPQMKENDLVLVSGEIVYENKPNGEKTVSVPHILAKKVIRMQKNNDSDDLEQLEKESVNDVKLLGMIAGEIINEKVSIFHVGTDIDITQKLSQNFTSEFHRVLVFDDNLREFVKNKLKRTDRLLINGEILYHKIDLEDGSFAFQGNIVAKRIQKLSEFKKESESEAPNVQQSQIGVE